VELMTSKINFLKDEVPPHLNIVRYMGESVDKTLQVPVLLLELCDMTLTDWLKNIQQVDVEVLENMLTFCLNIARGVEHLHANKIIHKRLAAHNVLLVKTVHGYIPKLIGFGPSKSDSSTNQMVPKKWLAPETLTTLRTNPTYNTKTDAWSFAILMCEIYSQGAEPYRDVRSDQILSFLESGQRMTCPDHFPVELFNQVVVPCWNDAPSMRPKFSVICQRIEEFCSEPGEKGQGYYAVGQSPDTCDDQSETGIYDDTE